jgi:hypothetical protein
MSNSENESEGLRELLARDHRELDQIFDAALERSLLLFALARMTASNRRMTRS